MMNLNEINGQLNKVDSVLKTQIENKQNGIKSAIKDIDSQISDLKNQYGINDRKSRKIVKSNILEALQGQTNKSVLRAYNIALNIEFRALKINIDLLSVAQIENLAKHGTKARINELFELDDTQYETDVKEYLKELKVRIVSVKTFAKVKK